MHIHVDIYAGNDHKDCLDTTNNIRSKWGTDDVECNLRFVVTLARFHE